MQALTGGPATAPRNGTGRHLDTVAKRDGRRVPFDAAKIRAAVRRCFANGTGLAEREAERHAGRVAAAVVNVLRNQEAPVDVEHVQRVVIQQLWAGGHFLAAEHYQNYREERRKARASAPVPADVAERVRADQKHFPTDLQYYQYMSKFARWREADHRRETWRETCHERVLPWLFNLPLVRGKLSEQERDELGRAMYDLEVSPAMRVVQMAGPALDRCHVGAYNCAYQPIEDLRSFPEMLYILMQGTGAGFSVESDYVDELPRIKKQKGKKPDTLVVEDTTEGWCDTYHEALQRWWDGHDVYVDPGKIRPAGARLLTKGGRSGGPDPFLGLIAYARNLVMKRQGRYLEDTDAHRLACMTGKIVQVGGVRRAATLSLSDLTSAGMRAIKSGNWWDADPYGVNGRHLSMANNSAVYSFDGPPPVETFMEEWLALVKSHSGERGIFNRKAALQHSPKRRKWGRHKPGCNPCAEILLRPYEFCNLSIAVARPDDTRDSLARKVRLAALFGVIQSTATDFRYIREDWKRNCEEERLLGVDITGHADCPLLRHGAPGRAELLDYLAGVVAAVRKEFAARFGINESAADTTVKPSGDSAIFFDCASGVTPRFAARQIRWVRERKDSPVAAFLKDAGVPSAEAPEDPTLLVFGFPKKAPAGATLRDGMSAREQFFNWLEWKQHWAEHSVSATIHVQEHEWPELGALVYQHVDHITGLSFMPKDNGTYTYAPNEELTEAQYNDFAAKFPELNWSKLPQYELEDGTEVAQVMACGNGGCDLN